MLQMLLSSLAAAAGPTIGCHAAISSLLAAPCILQDASMNDDRAKSSMQLCACDVHLCIWRHCFLVGDYRSIC